ncbi:MAG TPA: nucleotidyltransferase domain-containing protein [Candidatus Latescibacteria bacterium]|nr:nucleotidyltransferase domain-containing protein [Candidatus Latescibacterota bacterium]
MKIKEKISAFIDKAAADEVILAVILFGSRARGQKTSSSDVDLCLVLQPGDYSDLELSQKKLEYLAAFDVDVQVYQQLPLYIRRRVLKEGKVLFCRDEDKLYELAFRTVQEFEDFRHIYNSYLEGVAHG